MKRGTIDVEVVVAVGGRMQVEHVVADADRIAKRLGKGLSGHDARAFRTNVRLGHGELRPKATRFANVRMLREPVVRSGNVLPQTEPFPAGLAVGARRFGLEPVQQR